MSLSFAFIGSVYAIVAQVFGHALEIIDPLPQDPKVQIASFQNGLRAYILENEYLPKMADFKFLIRQQGFETINPSKGIKIISERISTDDEEALNFLFHSWKEKLQKEGLAAVDDFEDTHLANLVGVVAIGDFSKDRIETLIEKYFSDLKAHPSHDNAQYLASPSVSLKYSSTSSEPSFSIHFLTSNVPSMHLGDFRSQWMHVILQNMLKNRLSSKLKDLCNIANEGIMHEIIPCETCGVKMNIQASDVMHFMKEAIKEIEVLKEIGFTKEEFFLVKEDLEHKLKHLYQNHLTQPQNTLQDYYLNRFCKNAGHVSWDFFLENSPFILDQILFEEIGHAASEYIRDQNRLIEIELPDSYQFSALEGRLENELLNISNTLEEKLSDKELISAESLSNDSKDEKPSSLCRSYAKNHLFHNQTIMEVHKLDEFLSLPLEENERRTINSLIMTMAEKNILKLGLMRKTLERKGRRIHHVHPFRFLGYIFSTPHLKTCMQKIRRSNFKWDGFIDGLSKKMKEEYSKNNLIRYVPGFAEYLDLNPEHVMSYISKHDWDGLVRSLL